MEEYEYGNQIITYTLSEDGYDIFIDGELWLVQHEPYIPDKSKSYEENAIAQIEELISQPVYEDEVIDDEEHSEQDDVNAMLIEHEYRLTLIELGL